NSLDPQAEIRKNITAEVVPRTNLIRVGMSSDSADEAANVVNAVVDAYVRYALNTNNVDAERRIERLRETRDERTLTVNQRRQTLKTHQARLGSADTTTVQDRNKVTIDDYKTFSIQLTQVEIERISLESQIERLRQI